MYIYIYMYIYMSIYRYIHIYMYIYIYMSITHASVSGTAAGGEGVSLSHALRCVLHARVCVSIPRANVSGTPYTCV